MRRSNLARTCLGVLCGVILAGVLSLNGTGPVPVQAAVAIQNEAPSSDIAASEAKAGKTEKSEADQVNEYRHSPTVQWFAKLFHADVETTATIFEYINFAVIALAIGIPLFRMLPKTFKKRSEKLSSELETARAKTADANSRLSAVEAKLAGLDAEIAAIKAHVESEMASDEVRGKAAIEEEAARIVAAAEQEIVMAGSMAQRGLKKFAAELAIDRAMSRLTLDAEADKAMMAEFADQIEMSRNGGQN